MAKSNVLKLTTAKPKRQPIDLDGVAYELRPLADLDGRERAIVAANGAEYGILSEKGRDMTATDDEKSNKLLDELIAIYTTIPLTTVAELPYGLKVDISTAFINLSGISAEPLTV